MKYITITFILLSLIGIAIAVDLGAHNTVDFHTGQTASYSGTAGEDGGQDATDYFIHNFAIDREPILC